jgi:hypothetical protein
VFAPRLSRLDVAFPLSPRSGGTPGGTARDPRGACDAAAPAPAGAPCPPPTLADAWVDGALSPGGTAALEAHLRGCPACRAHVDAVRRLVAAVRRQGEHQPPAPASLRARVRALAARWHAADSAAPPRAGRAAPADVASAPAPAARPAIAARADGPPADRPPTDRPSAPRRAPR